MTDITRNVITADKTQPPLTTIERVAMQHVAAGHTNAQIGQHLGRNEKTVRNWPPPRVYAKLGVVNWARTLRRICAWKLGVVGECERNSHGRKPGAFQDIHPIGTMSAIA
jgi:DNA-binding NarL/FixJ family response regulator